MWAGLGSCVDHERGRVNALSFISHLESRHSKRISNLLLEEKDQSAEAEARTRKGQSWRTLLSQADSAVFDGLQIPTKEFQEDSIAITRFVIMKLIGHHGDESQWARQLVENKSWEIFPRYLPGTGRAKERNPNTCYDQQEKQDTYCMLHLCGIFRIGNPYRQQISGYWGIEGRKMGVTIMGKGFPFEVIKMFWN